jgi:hypothetical protein
MAGRGEYLALVTCAPPYPPTLTIFDFMEMKAICSGGTDSTARAFSVARSNYVFLLSTLELTSRSFYGPSCGRNPQLGGLVLFRCIGIHGQ